MANLNPTDLLNITSAPSALPFTKEDNDAFLWAHNKQNDNNQQALELRQMAKDARWTIPTMPAVDPTGRNVDESGYEATKEFLTTPQDEALKSYVSGYAEGFTGNLYKGLPVVGLEGLKSMSDLVGNEPEQIKSLDETIDKVKNWDESSKRAFPIFNDVGKLLGYISPWGIVVKGYGWISKGTNFIPKIAEKLVPKVAGEVGKIAGRVLGKVAQEATVGGLVQGGLAGTEELGKSGDFGKALNELIDNIPQGAKLGSVFGAVQGGAPEVTKLLEKSMPELFSAARGINPEVARIYANPTDRKIIKDMIKQPRGVLVKNLENNANNQLTSYVTKKNKSINDIIESTKGEVDLRPLATEARQYLNELKNVKIKDKLVNSAIDELENYVNQFTVKTSPSIILNPKGTPATPSKLIAKRSSVFELNEMRKRQNDLATSIYNQTEIKLPSILADRYKDLSDKTRKLMINAISKQSSSKGKLVDKYLTELHDLAKLQDQVNFKSVYAFDEPSTTADKLVKIASRYIGLKEQGIAEMDAIKAIDKMIGGTISKDTMRYLALKQLTNYDVISGLATGKSLAPFAIINSLLPHTGGKTDVLTKAATALWWLHTAPILTKPLITGYSTVNRGLNAVYGLPPIYGKAIKSGIIGTSVSGVEELKNHLTSPSAILENRENRLRK